MLTLDDRLSKRRRDFQEGKVILHPTTKIMTEEEEVLINLHRSLLRGIRSSSSSSSNLINSKIINHSTNNSNLINHSISNNSSSSSNNNSNNNNSSSNINNTNTNNINNNRKMVSEVIKVDRPISILIQMTIWV